MAQSLEARFAAYGEVVGTALAHADRQAPAQWHLKGLMSPGGRKSVEPMASRVLPILLKRSRTCHWIIDDTGFAKKDLHSVDVARQYCVRLGKTDNCQIAVSLSVANEHGSLPVGFRLYLPQEWAQDSK